MHEFNAGNLADLYQNPFAAPPLEHARDDFRTFFQSPEQFKKAIPYLDTEFVIYARFCKLVGDSQAKSLLINSISLAWNAFSVDKNVTQNIVALVASEADVANTTFWSLLKRYPDMPWKNETFLLRDRVSELLAFAAEYIEGVLKREMWSLLAFRDIANKSTKNPFRWQSEKLGNIVSSASALPEPLGSFFSQEPLPGITLNHFRNIGAHKDFSVVKETITLFPDTTKINTSLADLERGLNIVGKFRVPLKLANAIIGMHDIDGLIAAGYKPQESPETVAIGLTASLGADGISLKSIRHINDDTEVICSANQDFTDENLIFSVLHHLSEFIYAYQNTFDHTPSSKIKVEITNSNEKVIEASFNTDEAIKHLNSIGYSEIPFELKMNGITGMAKLKVNIGNNPLKFS